MDKGEIAQNQQFHLFPQCFLCNLYLEILCHISVVVCSFLKFGAISKWCIGEWVKNTYMVTYTFCIGPTLWKLNIKNASNNSFSSNVFKAWNYLIVCLRYYTVSTVFHLSNGDSSQIHVSWNTFKKYLTSPLS